MYASTCGGLPSRGQVLARGRFIHLLRSHTCLTSHEHQDYFNNSTHSAPHETEIATMRGLQCLNRMHEGYGQKKVAVAKIMSPTSGNGRFRAATALVEWQKYS